MLTAARSLVQNVESGRELPRVPALVDLYRAGTIPRQGEVIMIAGRSGTQKSGFALWYTVQIGLPTLYISADMSAFTASVRLASMGAGQTTEQVQQGMNDPVLREQYLQQLEGLSVQFSFGAPITVQGIQEELDAYVELWDAWPSVIVFDNLMDFDGAEANYEMLMSAMAVITDIARQTGATCIVLHHASDKSFAAKDKPWAPPSRDEIKYGLSEKPELTLAVALDSHSMAYNIATLKQRMGRSDPTGQSYVTIRAEPEYTRFHRYT